MYYLYWFSLSTLFWLVLLLLLGILWTPFAAFISYMISRGKERQPTRYAFVAAICSVLFILPWVAMIVPVRFRSVATIIVVICAYVTWLIGPLGFLFISIDNEFFYGSDTGLLTGIVVAMSLIWVATLIWMIQTQIRHTHQYGLLPVYKVIVPSVGLWISVIAVALLFYMSDY